MLQFYFKTQVSKYWNILALDGSNWQKIDLFYFQMDIEVSRKKIFNVSRIADVLITN